MKKYLSILGMVIGAVLLLVLAACAEKQLFRLIPTAEADFQAQFQQLEG